MKYLEPQYNEVQFNPQTVERVKAEDRDQVMDEFTLGDLYLTPDELIEHITNAKNNGAVRITSYTEEEDGPFGRPNEYLQFHKIDTSEEWVRFRLRRFVAQMREGLKCKLWKDWQREKTAGNMALYNEAKAYFQANPIAIPDEIVKQFQTALYGLQQDPMTE